MAGEIFRAAFTGAELLKATTALVAGEIVRIGEYKVEAGEEISVGYGQLAGFDNATGRIFMDLRDSTASPGVVLSGTVRIEAYSAQNRNRETIAEFRTEDLSSNPTDKTKQLPMPEHALWLREDQRLVLHFIPDEGGVGNGTLSKANSKILVAMTRKSM